MGFERIDCTVPEFIDPVFAKTSPKRSFSVIEYERFGLVFAKSGSINSGTVVSYTVQYECTGMGVHCPLNKPHFTFYRALAKYTILYG